MRDEEGKERSKQGQTNKQGKATQHTKSTLTLTIQKAPVPSGSTKVGLALHVHAYVLLNNLEYLVPEICAVLAALMSPPVAKHTTCIVYVQYTYVQCVLQVSECTQCCVCQRERERADLRRWVWGVWCRGV